MERSKSAKRKLPISLSSGIQRRVRARKEEPDLEELEEAFSDSSAEGNDNRDEEDQDSQSESSDENEVEDEDEEEDEEDEGPALDASQLSFGALAKAQAALPNIRRKQQAQEDSDSDSSGPTETISKKSIKPVQGRTNKHAPAEQTSKRAVSRKREVVAVHKTQARDPRFGPLGLGSTTNSNQEEVTRKNYAFLSSYREREMAELRHAIKTTKDVAAKEELKRALMSMASRKKAQELKDAEKKVVEDHRRREKELVKQGKKPFYLKKSERKKQVLMDRFAAMKKKQVDRVLERKRKNIASKEKKNMPMARRER